MERLNIDIITDEKQPVVNKIEGLADVRQTIPVTVLCVRHQGPSTETKTGAERTPTRTFTQGSGYVVVNGL